MGDWSLTDYGTNNFNLTYLMLHSDKQTEQSVEQYIYFSPPPPPKYFGILWTYQSELDYKLSLITISST